MDFSFSSVVPLVAKSINKFYKPIIWEAAGGGWRGTVQKCTVTCSAYMASKTSPLSTSEHTAEFKGPGNDNELFQQFLPESPHNVIHLPDSSEAEPPSPRPLFSTTLCSSKFTLHASAPIYNSLQVIKECIRPLNEKYLGKGREREEGKININGCVPNWLVCLIKDTITQLYCNYPPSLTLKYALELVCVYTQT